MIGFNCKCIDHPQQYPTPGLKPGAGFRHGYAVGGGNRPISAIFPGGSALQHQIGSTKPHRGVGFQPGVLTPGMGAIRGWSMTTILANNHMRRFAIVAVTQNHDWV